MINRRPPPLLDMMLDGRVRSAPRAPVLARVIGVAVVVAVLCAALSLAALAIWVAAMLIPVVIVAVAVAWVALKVSRWQTGGAARGRQFMVRWPPR